MTEYCIRVTSTGAAYPDDFLVARLDELERKFEENPRRYFAPLANEYRKAGDARRAADLCRSQLPEIPGHISGHIVLGQSLFDAGDFPGSRAALETALALDPENIVALRYLGDIARET
ncbi:MAG: tetratricopeptide repeat protein, partial [Gemmatimonadaceae bacterium]